MFLKGHKQNMHVVRGVAVLVHKIAKNPNLASQMASRLKDQIQTPNSTTPSETTETISITTPTTKIKHEYLLRMALLTPPMHAASTLEARWLAGVRGVEVIKSPLTGILLSFLRYFPRTVYLPLQHKVQSHLKGENSFAKHMLTAFGVDLCSLPVALFTGSLKTYMQVPGATKTEPCGTFRFYKKYIDVVKVMGTSAGRSTMIDISKRHLSKELWHLSVFEMLRWQFEVKPEKIYKTPFERAFYCMLYSAVGSLASYPSTTAKSLIAQNAKRSLETNTAAPPLTSLALLAGMKAAGPVGLAGFIMKNSLGMGAGAALDWWIRNR
jgi:hypothetical protein